MSTANLTDLKAALTKQAVSLRAVDIISLRAHEFYRAAPLHPHISKAQMAAVGDKLRRADTLEAAETAAVNFLKHQMSKLEKREENGAAPSSWRKRVPGTERAVCLGDRLIAWVLDRGYARGAEGIQHPDRALLQRAWYLVETLYQHHKNFGRVAAIKKENVS